MEYIDWTYEKIVEFLKDKEKDRGVDPGELLTLSKFIKDHRFKRIFELGTFLGASGYIIGTSSPDIEVFVSSDIGRQEMDKYNKKHRWDYDDYGKYLPSGTIYIEGDFRDNMDTILKKYKPEFVFLDDGHTPNAIWEQLMLCYNNNVKYVALHDTGKIVRKVRRAVKRAINTGMYKMILENLESCPEKGISFLERVE